ncbi:MAG: AhpC/TSA family protein [Bacteroidales bacterium]|nr:AhpC/TSA family protein [Bacteroidales bacterium]
MKKIFILLTIVCLLISCSKTKTFQISGKLTDFLEKEPTMLFLKIRNADNELINIDSTYLDNDGAFVLKGKSSETDLYYLADSDNAFVIGIFVDPGDKITVNGSVFDFDNIKIQGSKTQTNYEEFLSLVIPKQNEQENIRQKYGYITNDLSISEEDRQSIIDELVFAFDELNNEIDSITIDYIGKNSSTIIAAYLVYRYVNMLDSSVEIEEQLQLLDPAMNHKFITLSKAILEKVKQTEVGSVLPNIELPDENGKLVSLESLRGKYVLVDFWATWCSSCMSEILHLKKIYHEYHTKGFEIYSISLDYSNEEWLAGIERYDLNWITVTELPGSPTAKQMAIKYIPTSFLLDPNGVIVAVNASNESLMQILEEVIH